ncbi:unnamed protein product [Dibothriocephalus latus]|uniref:Uncharacterized protein n=1 Tax=Dibothriocephalus latus TaxID=60516 RepID=A0A3P6TQ88_DIBLA|nr:unnamed protein product [Dibothriocephalus latus]
MVLLSDVLGELYQTVNHMLNDGHPLTEIFILPRGDLAGLTLLRGTFLDSEQLQCFIDCHARFSLDSGAFRGISPDTRVTWETPFNSILIDSFDSQQVIENERLVNPFCFFSCEDSDEILHTKPTIIYVTGTHSTAVKGFAEDHADTLPFLAVPSEDSGSTTNHVDMMESGKDATAAVEVTEDEAEEEEEVEPDLSDSQPCAYRLRLHSALVDSQAGKTLQVTGLCAGDGQLLVPDMEIYWEANSARCQEILEEHEINVLSCSIGTCMPSESGLRLDSEQLSLHGFDQASLHRLNISTELDNEGLSISGKGSLETYAQLLRNLGWSYSRRSPGVDMSRCFLMQCTATIQDNMNRVIAFHRSNQIAVKVRTIPPC